MKAHSHGFPFALVQLTRAWRSLLTTKKRLTIPFLLLSPYLLLLGLTGDGFAQLSVKGGIAESGYRLSPVDAGTSQEIDFRPFLGYEVGWIQYGTSNPDVGWQLGVSYAARLSENLSVQPELHFAEREYRFEQIERYNTSGLYMFWDNQKLWDDLKVHLWRTERSRPST